MVVMTDLKYEEDDDQVKWVAAQQRGSMMMLVGVGNGFSSSRDNKGGKKRKTRS